MKKILFLIGGLVIILIVVKLIKGGDFFQDSKPGERNIIATAESYVSKELKAPSSAEFSSLSETSIREVEPNVYEVRGFVDAQNSFGAKLRSNYFVKLHFSPYNKSYSLLDIKIK